MDDRVENHTTRLLSTIAIHLAVRDDDCVRTQLTGCIADERVVSYTSRLLSTIVFRLAVRTDECRQALQPRVMIIGSIKDVTPYKEAIRHGYFHVISFPLLEHSFLRGIHSTNVHGSKESDKASSRYD